MGPREREAGRTLDAEIAEQVMGLKPREVRVKGTTNMATIYSDSPYFSGDAYSRADIWHAEARPYSTDIAAAWEVIERMDARGFHARVQSPFEPGQQYVAGFTPHGFSGWNGRPDFAAVASTAPLAICLAALRAVAPTPEADRAEP